MKKKRIIWAIVIIAVLLAIVVTLTLVSTSKPRASTKTAVSPELKSSEAAYGPEILYTSHRTPLRASPKNDGEKIITLPMHAKITTIGRTSGGWLKVRYNTYVGYIKPEDLTVFVGTTLYTTRSVAMRGEPSTSSDKITTVPAFEPVIVTTTNRDGWYKVLYANNAGYIPAKYLTREQQGTITTTTLCDLWLRSSYEYSDDNKLVLMPEGSTVTIIQGQRRDSSKERTWYKVRYGTHEGWAPEEHLADIYPLVYYDGDTTITVYKEWFRHSYVYSAHIQTSSYTRMGMYDPSGKWDNAGYTTTNAASKIGAVLCVNGDYSAKMNYNDYVCGVVRRGEVILDDKYTGIAYYNNHTGKLYSNESGNSTYRKRLSDLVSQGVLTDTINFYWIMPIKDGKSRVPANYDKVLRPRTLIGTNENPGDIWLIVADGDKRDGKSIGLNQKDRADILLSKGCTLGFGMDGGGSSTMVLFGIRLTSLKKNEDERPVIDFFFVR